MTEKYVVATNMITLLDRDMAIWKWLVSRGIANSIAGLSRMIGQELNVNELDVNHIMDKDAVDLLGGKNNTVVGIYLTITGDATGHLLLAHDSKVALSVIDYQMQLSPGSTTEIGEMELSLLGEMGNIVGAFFLNVLSDVTNLHLSPSPPKVMINTAGMVMNKVFTDIFNEQDTVFTVKAKFGANGQQTEGTFLIIPTPEFMQTVLEHARITR